MNLYDKASLIVTPNAYKAGKIYSAKPTSGLGDLTFARATAQTRRNSLGIIENLANNVPALDYPTVGGCPWWNFPVARTNLFQNSASRAANWVMPTTITRTTPAGTNPQGQATEELLTVNGTYVSGATSIIQSVTKAASAIQYTCYAIVKRGASNWVLLQCDDDTNLAGAWFNLNTKVVGATRTSGSGFTLQTKTIEDDVAGYVRISITVTSTTATSIVGRLFLVNEESVLTSAIGNSVFVWQMQLEAGAYGTAPIITPEGASLTRVLANPNTSGLTSFIGQTEGSWYTEFRTGAVVPATGDIISLGLNVSNNIALVVLGGTLRLFVYYNSTNFSINTGISILTNTTYKCAVRYQSGNTLINVNGSTFTSSTAFAFTASLGDLTYPNAFFQGERYPVLFGENLFYLNPLTNAELLALTT